jgi:hypothetical protein
METVPAGKAYNIKWDATTNGTLTISLTFGPYLKMQQIATIAKGIENTGSLTWTPNLTLQDSTDDSALYGLHLIPDETPDKDQWSDRFKISNPTQQTTTASPSSSGSSSAESSTTVAVSSGSDTASTASGSVSAGSSTTVAASSASSSKTDATNTLATQSSRTSSIPSATSSAPKQQSKSGAASTAGSMKDGLAVAALAGILPFVL